MRLSIFPLMAMLLACLGGQGMPGASSCVENKEAAWKLLKPGGSSDLEEMAREVEAFRVACGLPLLFWAGPEAEQKQKEEHPCGEVVEAFVKAIPSPSDPVTQSEKVFEFSGKGKIVRRWWVPVDSHIAGIAGRELLVSEERGEDPHLLVHLAIKPGGVLRVIALSENSTITRRTCPKIQDLPKSDYMACWNVVDKTDGAIRRIAYEAPCS